LSGEQQQQLTKRHTKNPEAYQLYLRGRHHQYKGTAESLKKSIEHFYQAIALDPSYALAYAELADSYSLLNNWTFGGGAKTGRRVVPRFRSRARRHHSTIRIEQDFVVRSCWF
jgi:hypothetical protein